jgi:hypothetical protein
MQLWKGHATNKDLELKRLCASACRSYEPETLLPSKQLSNTKQGKPRKKDALEQRQEQPHDTQIADQEELVPFHLSDDEEEEDGSHENLLKRKQPQPSMMQKARSTKKKMRGN